VGAQVTESRMEIPEILPAPVDEAIQLLQLTKAHGSLHVGELEVVAEMAVGVFVVITMRQVAQLPIETLMAGVVDPWFAPAVPSPIPEGFYDLFEPGILGQHGAALAHGQVVCGVEAHRGQVAEGSHLATLVFGTDRVAAILDDPESVPLCQGHDGFQVERVAQGMRQDDGPGPRPDRCREALWIGVIRGQGGVHEDGHQAILQDGRDRGGEACCTSEDLISGSEPTFTQLGRGQSRDREQVGAGA